MSQGEREGYSEGLEGLLVDLLSFFCGVTTPSPEDLLKKVPSTFASRLPESTEDFDRCRYTDTVTGETGPTRFLG